MEWLKKGLIKLERSSIPVARIGLQPTEELEHHILAGPYHPALHQLIHSAIALDMAASLLQIVQKGTQAFFLCHPKEISNMRGQRNENIMKLKERFGLEEMFILGRDDVLRGSIVLQTQKGSISMQRKDLRYDES